METKIVAVARASEPGPNVAPAIEPLAPASEPKVAPAQDPVDVRLVIEQDQASGSYIYKTVNRVTGEILQQLPRADVLKLHQGPGYASGALIRTKA